MKINENSDLSKVEALCKDLHSYTAEILDYTKKPLRIASGLNSDYKRVKIYHLQDPKDTERFRCGFCWDIACLALSKLRDFGYDAYAVYIERAGDDSDFPENHVTVVFNDEAGKIIFEASTGKIYGPFSSDAVMLLKLAKIMKSFFNEDVDIQDLNFYKIDSYPEAGCTAQEFIIQVRKGKFFSFDNAKTYSKFDSLFEQTMSTIDSDAYLRCNINDWSPR